MTNRSIQQDFLEVSDSYLKSLPKEVAKTNGIVFTPQWLARHITNTAFKQWTKFNAGMTPKSACDLCCGTGVFIRELLSMVSENSYETKIYAFDTDKEAINIANSYFGSDVNIANIETKDSLQYNRDSNSNDRFDLIVGNPPYVNSSMIKDPYKLYLKNNYTSASNGVFDLSVVFIEETLNSLNEGGVASLIVSNKFMTSKYGKDICKVLSERCHLIKIEDFGDTQIFKGLITYTCILTFIKAKHGKRHTLVRYLSDGKKSYNNLPPFIEESIDHEKLQTHPWSFNTKEEASIQRKLNAANTKSIYDIFRGIQQGIRTGANDVFLVEESVKNALNSELIKKFISGENIKGLAVTETDKFIIYPYLDSNGSFSQIPETTFKKDHPKLYSYLLDKKEVLNARSLQGNAQWFEFSRSQSLDSVTKPKILVREMMPTAVFSADTDGQYVFSSGYAFICDNMDKDSIVMWAAILSTPIMEFAMRNIGTQLHSGWFRLMKNHLDNLRLPSIEAEDKRKIINAIKTADKSDYTTLINDIVAKSFKLEKHELKHIVSFLQDIHKRSQPSINSQATNVAPNYEPVKLDIFNKLHIDRDDLRQGVTFSLNKKSPIHNWYKYTQGFSSNLVNTLLDEYGATCDSIVLDPFNGCGTTVLACAYRGIDSIGIEISPLMCEVARIKSRKWSLDKISTAVKNLNLPEVSEQDIRPLVFKDYFDKAYSNKILSKILDISASIKKVVDCELRDFYTIGLLSILEDVSKIRKHGSHYRFLNNASSVGLQKLNIEVVNDDTDIYGVFQSKLHEMYRDLCSTGGIPKAKVKIIAGSCLKTTLKSESVDIVITSPPYLNRNNYIAQQKAELDLLNIVKNKNEYKKLVKSTFRSHTDSNLTSDAVSPHKEVNEIINSLVLEEGNNPKIPHMICGYFDDLELSLKEIYRVLKKGGKASLVVGNTRWGGIVVPIDHLLAKFAEDSGFEVSSIYVTRLKGNSPQQMKAFGKISVRESIVNIVKT